MENRKSSQIVLPCSSLDETVDFFKDRLGFRIDMISPADDPSLIIISGYGINIRLERNIDDKIQSSPTIRLILKDDDESNVPKNKELIAPNGTKIEFVESVTKLIIPPLNQSFVVSRMNLDGQWVKGRAGMNYRDLIPGRQGGRFIASHIEIIEGGPVNDYVHYHHIKFQMIYVYKGWVRLVYENEGDAFVLHAGDCVLQPPLIRHRVLESSPGLQVIEIACPSIHDTYIDHDIKLPNDDQQSDRQYGGQRFVKYIDRKEKTEWKPWRLPNLQYHDMGIGVATQGLAEVRIIRSTGDIKPQLCQHNAELVFIFVLTGQLSLNVNSQTIEMLTHGDAFVIPEKLPYTFVQWSNDLRLLEVSLPQKFQTTFLEN